MIPVEQTCPKCHSRFKGSDIIGYPCPSCMAIDNYSDQLQEALNQLYKGIDNGRSKSS